MPLVGVPHHHLPLSYMIVEITHGNTHPIGGQGNRREFPHSAVFVFSTWTARSRPRRLVWLTRLWEPSLYRPQGAIKNPWTSGVACIKAPLTASWRPGRAAQSVSECATLEVSTFRQTVLVSSNSTKTNLAVLTRRAHGPTGTRFLDWIHWLPLSWSGATRLTTINGLKLLLFSWNTRSASLNGFCIPPRRPTSFQTGTTTLTLLSSSRSREPIHWWEVESDEPKRSRRQPTDERRDRRLADLPILRSQHLLEQALHREREFLVRQLLVRNVQPNPHNQPPGGKAKWQRRQVLQRQRQRQRKELNGFRLRVGTTGLRTNASRSCSARSFPTPSTCCHLRSSQLGLAMGLVTVTGIMMLM